jgi:copper homeostasis protein
MSFKLEVIAFDIESCQLIEKAGAHRIELCDNPGDGGTTPSYGMIQLARKNVSIDLFPIIRPRGGDFLYSNDEFEIMKTDIGICKKLGCDGVVTGLLNTDGSIDKKRTTQLVELAYPMSVTFHRAFDRSNDPFSALTDIIDSGCERILTSGQHKLAINGIDLIAALIKKADNEIIIMPGSGIRSENINEIVEQTNATEFHTSARISKNSEMNFQKQSMNETLQHSSIDEIELATILNSLYQIL